MDWMQHLWDKTWKAAGAGNCIADVPFNALVKFYAEPHRKYHTLQHIRECLDIFDKVDDLAEYPEEVKIALWYHDAIYQPQSAKNELDSAGWAWSTAAYMGLSNDQMSRIHRLVRCTDHKTVPNTIDEKLIVDVDLAILGVEAARYDEYESQVREEYSFVPDEIFWPKRKEILQSFIDREFIYINPRFRVAFEQSARANISRSLLHK